jgi:hypothetical protein
VLIMNQHNGGHSKPDFLVLTGIGPQLNETEGAPVHDCQARCATTFACKACRRAGAVAVSARFGYGNSHARP